MIKPNFTTINQDKLRQYVIQNQEDQKFIKK